MVIGFESFQEWFRGYEDAYVIIGGVACDLIMSEEALPFRATKDIDMVLIVEAITTEFVERFWGFVREAGYEHRNKSKDKPQFYRFTHPRSTAYPAMIELFSRKMDGIDRGIDTQLVPITMDGDVSSLSAILLNDAYYQFLREGKYVIAGIPVLRPEYIIPFKAKAWLDLSERKGMGEPVDSKNIKKHKNDVFRLSVFITGESHVKLPEMIYEDMYRFLNLMEKEEINLKNLGIPGTDKEVMLRLLRSCYL